MEELSKKSKKLLKKMIRESKPEPFIVNGKTVYFNPLKKLLKGEPYESSDGLAVTKEMVKKYEQFLKTAFQHKKLAKEIKEADNGSK